MHELKVLQVLLPVGMGGVESIADMLDRFLRNNNISSYVAIGQSFIEQYIKQFNIKDEDKAHIISIPDSNIVQTIYGIKKIVKEIQPDIVQTHARRECVFCCLVARHTIIVRTQHMQEKPSLKVSAIEKKLLEKKVTSWIATSHTLEKKYLDKLAYIDNKKVSVIYNGVDDLFENSLSNKKKSLSFCVISRLTRQKGIDILISEINKLPRDVKKKIHVDIWGEGPELENIEQLIIKNNLSNIIAYKYKIRNPRSIFNQYSALLMPSRYEGLPLTMLEAMSFKLPVAIHNVGCCSEFIRNNINGWIIDDRFTWRNFFDNFIKMQDAEYQTISNNARKTFLDKFEMNKMCFAYYKLYLNDLKISEK